MFLHLDRKNLDNLWSTVEAKQQQYWLILSFLLHDFKPKTTLKAGRLLWWSSLYRTNGDTYAGDWREGVPQGQGEFTYGGNRTGDRYVGQYDKVRLISGTLQQGEIDREIE